MDHTGSADAYIPRTSEHPGSDAYKPRTIEYIGLDAYIPRRSNTGAIIYMPGKSMEYTSSDAYGPRTSNTGANAYVPRISNTGANAYIPREPMEHTGLDAYKPGTIEYIGLDAYIPRRSNTGAIIYMPRKSMCTGLNAYVPRISNTDLADAYMPRISMDYTTCSTNVIAPAVAMNIVTGFVVLLIVLLELSYLWRGRQNDNVNPTPPAPPARSPWQFCHDAGESLDDEASVNLGSLSRSRRQEEFMEDVLQKLFAFGGECQNDLRRENPLQKQVIHIHNFEAEIFVWLIRIEALLERIYERLRFLYCRLAVYTMACLWSYSEFPGRIRPPCTTMPWTIWPALVVLWGVCWMFYPSPGRTPGTTESESQSHLDYQPQSEEIGGELLLSGLDDVNLISHSFWDSSISDEWWTSNQPSTIYDSMAKALGHDMEAFTPGLISQPVPTTTVDPAGRSTDPSRLGSASQLTLSPGFQRQFQVQGIRTTEDSAGNIVVTPLRPIATNQLKCPDCDKVLARQDSLRRHRQTQHNREVEEHLCPHKPCKRSRPGSGFSRPDGLRRHLKACKSRRRRVLTVLPEAVDSQPESGNETREDGQARSYSHDTGMENSNDGSNQESSSDSLIVGLRRHLAEAEAASDKAKHEYEEAQKKVAIYKTAIEMLEKEHAA